MPDYLQVQVVSHHNRTQFSDVCQSWVEQPAVMYAGMEFDDVNIYHFFLDNFLRIFTTVTQLGFFDLDKFLARCDP